MAAAALGTNLSQKLGQRLSLTPQLTQSLKVLAMNAVELSSYLEECLEKNPLLELDSEQQELAGEVPESAMETQNEEQAWNYDDGSWETSHSSSNEGGLSDSDQQWHVELSLGDSLHEQVDCQPMPEQTRMIAHALIDSLDDDGYFRANPSELAKALGVTAAQVVDVLEQTVQELEPAGIGSRNLSECLLLQLSGEDKASKLARRLLLHFADSLQENDMLLAHKVDCSVQDLQQARQCLRRLDPFPGHGLRGEDNIYVCPEIIFRRLEHGEIEVEVPGSGWRGVRINEQWKHQQWHGKDKDFMDAAAREAKWLLHALDQRSETLMKVGLCLAEQQKAFLEYGVLGLKPLTLQDVAELVGLHESTVSRVINGKYAHTPLGLIELRHFFSAGVAMRGGGMISVHRVQQRVKVLIQSEPADKPISDQAIADRLMREGIDIARRTVSKYREQLGLPSSSQRKRAALARTSQVRR